MAAISNKPLMKNAPSSTAMAKAMSLGALSKSKQLEAQRISPAINEGGQFNNSQTPNIVPNLPENFAGQGIKDLYAPVQEDWFWQNWKQNALANGMQTGSSFQEAGVMPKLGKVYVPDQYWDYAKKKQEQAFQEDFNRFVFSQFDVKNPAARSWWEKKYPGYTKSVYDAWKTKMQVEAKLAEIQIKGFHTEADLWFAFQYQNGYFERMLAPPTDRLVPIDQDEPYTYMTNATTTERTPPNALTWKMPPIP